MARRRRASRKGAILAILALIALAAAAWLGFRHLDRHLHEVERQKVLVQASAERIEPANEGLHVQIGGRLTAGADARDGELGIGTRAAVLFRKVEMYQWRERCEAGACSYEPTWSSQPIDSRTFRQPNGHENPPLRLADAHFAAADIRVGAFSVDAELAATQVAAADYPIHVADLPPNLAASFSDAGGMLYAGVDPAHPRVGEVRVSYRVAPLGNVVLNGVQRGSRLTAQ